MAGSGVRAEPFKLSVEVAGAEKKETATNEVAAGGKESGRAILEERVGARLTARWKVSYSATEAAKDAVVHFVVVKTLGTGQPPPPLDPAAVVVESALTMDFDSDAVSRSEIPFAAPKPGVYLVLIEVTVQTGSVAHEEHAMLDLVVK